MLTGPSGQRCVDRAAEPRLQAETYTTNLFSPLDWTDSAPVCVLLPHTALAPPHTAVVAGCGIVAPNCVRTPGSCDRLYVTHRTDRNHERVISRTCNCAVSIVFDRVVSTFVACSDHNNAG